MKVNILVQVGEHRVSLAEAPAFHERCRKSGLVVKQMSTSIGPSGVFFNYITQKRVAVSI